MTGQFLTPETWRGRGRTDFPAESWEADGEMMLHALPTGEKVDLVSRQRYGDFDLTFHWRLPIGGNSGVFYRVEEDAIAPWQSGPEMQLVHDAGHPDGAVPETSCGAIYGLHAPADAPPCPPGLFNVGRISVRGSLVEHWMNGVRVLSCNLASDAFRARVAHSKFRDFPRFAKAVEGHLVLQHHGGEVWFDSLRIELPRVE